MEQALRTLERSAVFASAKPETRRELFRAGQVRPLAPRQIFHQFREPVDRLYIQLEGKTVVYNMTRSGSRRILFIFGPGDVLNLGLWTAHPSSLYYEALEKGRVFTVPLRELSSAMAGDFGLTRAVMEEQERKLLRLSHQLKNTVGGINFDRKLAAKLWKLARDFGVPAENGAAIDMNLTVTLLADLLGTPRETVSRACKSLTEKGLIVMERRRITVSDMDRIRHYFHTGELI